METATARDPQSGTEPEGRYEVVDGQVRLKPELDPYSVELGKILALGLDRFGHARKIGRAYFGMLYLLDPATRLQLRPDVSFVSIEQWPLEARLPRGKWSWEIAPDLAVEIISPTNQTNDDMRKLAQYFQAGVKQVWVVYPSVEQVYVYRSLTEVLVLTRADVLDAGPVVPGFQISVNDLFGEG